ncbi:Type II secretion system protein D precursor [Lacunisphaera limnophila]|uniref:Type II secretion system protein D n=2 Tax=Lacunisphaera limnophila TaxID=1838286 RepID=A0A1D8AUR4_9BACT|nr:Type II secretion system protein D precursor [Lacunisphaera limnophila]
MLITLLATALTLPALAQDATPTPEPAAPAESAVTVEGAAPTAGTVSREHDTLSVDFPDEDIKTILRNVADLFELNLVVPDTLTGKTSIKLRDVTWQQIFQVVLSPVGYTYIPEGNIIKIVSNDTLQQEPAATEVFILNNAAAASIKPTIDGLIDAAAGGKIVIDSRSNALVITERPSRMGRIRTIIDQLDKATAQVMIESQFVEVTDRDVRNIGVNWASLQGVSLGARGLSQEFERTRGQDYTNGGTTSTTNGGTNTNSSTNGSTNSTTNTSNTLANGPVTTTTTINTGGLNTSTTQTNTGSQLGTNAVTGLPQVVLVDSIGTTTSTAAPTSQVNSTTIATAPTTNTTNGSTGNLTDSVTNTLSTTASSAINQLLGLTNTGGTSRLTSAVFSASDFNVIVSALKTQNNTKVVSNPTVVTLNNTEAVLNIGSEFPIPSYTYNSERGTFEVSGFQYKPIGIIMKVTPQVNAQGTIRLALEPEVSQQNGETTFGGAGGATIPIIATRKVKTQISLKDGYTAGIGGLVTSNKNHGGTKVPILGDIPGLGRLFSSKSVNDSTTNLLIFITAKTVNADGAEPGEVFTASALESVGMADKK